MTWTSTKRRTKTVASKDVEPLSQVLHRTFMAARDSAGELDLEPDSPFWVEFANGVDFALRVDAPLARHRSDD